LRFAYFFLVACKIIEYDYMNLAEEMDVKDEELRETIKTLWPIQGNAMAYILVPPTEGLHNASIVH